LENTFVQFLKWVIGPWLLITGLILLVLELGRNQPVPPSLQALHFDDCALPCWIGIIPGKTTIGEAERNIARTFSGSANYSLFHGDGGYWDYQITDKQTGNQVHLRLNSIAGQPTSAIVDDLTIMLEGESGFKIYPGDLEHLLGSPKNIRLSSPGDAPQPVLIYGDGRIHAFTTRKDCYRLTVDESVNFLEIYAQFPEDYAWVSLPLTWTGYSKCNRFVP
jgi:hypothetical protein